MSEEVKKETQEKAEEKKEQKEEKVEEKKEEAKEEKQEDKKEEAKEAKTEEKKEEAKTEEKKEEAKEEAEEKKEKKPVSAKVKKILDEVTKLDAEERAQLGIEMVKNLTVLELSDWVKSMEDEFGVSAAPVAAAGVAAPAAGGAGGAKEEEKTEFDVELSNTGNKKIQVIKEVRTLTSLGLKEAKQLVDSAPKVVKEAVTKEEAEEIKKKLEDVGATVEIK